MASGARHAGEIRERVESEVHFSGRATIFVASNFFDEIAGEFAGIDKFQEREIWIETGRNDTRVNFFAALENHAVRSSIFKQNFRDGCFRADFNTGFARGAADSIGNSARAAS